MQKKTWLAFGFALVAIALVIWLFVSGHFGNRKQMNQSTTIADTISITQQSTTSTTAPTTTMKQTKKVLILTESKLDNYVSYSSYDPLSHTPTTSNLEYYFFEDNAINQDLDSYVNLATARCKTYYLDYIAFFAPFNAHVLDGTFQKVVDTEGYGTTPVTSEFTLNEDGTLNSIVSYENGLIIDQAEYSYNGEEVTLHLFNRNNSGFEDTFTITRDNEEKNTKYQIERDNNGNVISITYPDLDDLPFKETFTYNDSGLIASSSSQNATFYYSYTEYELQ